MPEWIPVAAASDCPPGSSIERVAADRMVAIANVAGRYHAIDGLCPHQGGPLGTGMLCGTVLTCPWHGWQFDVTTGCHRISATVRQTVHEVCERDGMIWVRLAGAGDSRPAAIAPPCAESPARGASA
jgi:nitrite reductase/ring-hydroxylating ferredoxin subunit